MEKKDMILLKLEEAEMFTTTTKKYDNRKPWTPNNPKIIKSVIPGLILELLVKEGDMIKAGQTLLTLESMKMANHIKSPIDGKIKTILVKTGENIPKGYTMIELA